MRIILDETMFIVKFLLAIMILFPISFIIWLYGVLVSFIKLPYATIDTVYKKLKNY